MSNRHFVACLGLTLAVTTLAFVTEAPAASEGREVHVAQSDAAEKEAFESAKALGTVEAWDAFLTHFPGGFRADLARAYVKQLGAKPAAGPAPTPAPVLAPAPNPAENSAVTRVRYPGGEFTKTGPANWTEQGQSGRAIFQFQEISRSAQAIELYDASRSVYITLDVASRIIWYKDAGSSRSKLYDIVDLGGGSANYPAQRAAERSCREQSTIASSNSNTPAKITFINNSGVQRAILWIDFNGRIKHYADLSAGQQITLDTFLTHPWLVSDGPGNCVKIVLPEPGASVAYLDGGGREGPAYVPRRAEPDYAPSQAEPRYFSTRPKREASPSYSCGSGKTRVDGKCIRRADTASYCGPGFHAKGGKCVPGYRAPKASDGLPTGQKEAVGKGCPKGQVWNKAEGCHEDD